MQCKYNTTQKKYATNSVYIIHIYFIQHTNTFILQSSYNKKTKHKNITQKIQHSHTFILQGSFTQKIQQENTTQECNTHTTRYKKQKIKLTKNTACLYNTEHTTRKI